MEDKLKQWIEGAELPSDYYELVGQQRFYPKKGVLFQTIRKMTRVLLAYQDRVEAAKFDRVDALQNMLGKAEQTFTDDSDRCQYDKELLERLCAEYARGAGADVSAWRPHLFKRWLANVGNVHPSRLDQLVQSVIQPVQKSAPTKAKVRLVMADEPEPKQPADARTKTRVPSPDPSAQTSGAADVLPRTPTSADPSASGPQPKVDVAARRPKPERKSSHPGRGSAGAEAGTEAAGRPRRPPPPSSRKRKPPPGPTSSGGPGPDSGIAWIVLSGVVAAVIVALIVLLVALLFRNQPDPDADNDPNSDPAASDPQAPAPDQENRDAPSPAALGSTVPGAESASRTARSADPITEAAPVAPLETQSEPLVAARPRAPPTGPVPSAIPHGPVLVRHGQPVSSVSWSTDGTRLAVAGGSPAVGIWNTLGTGRETELEGRGGQVTAVRFSPDQEVLVTGDDTGRMSLWDASAWSLVATGGAPGAEPIRALAWLPDAGRLAAGDDGGGLSLWDSGTLELVHQIDQGAQAGAIQSLSPLGTSQGRPVVCAYSDGSVAIWDLDRMRALGMIALIDGPLWRQAMAQSPPAELAGVVATPQCIAEVFHDIGVRSGGTMLAVAHHDVSIWDTDGKVCVRARILPWPWDQGGYCTADWSPDGTLLAAGSGTGQLHVWETENWRIVFARQYTAPITALEWGPGDGRLAIGLDDGTVTILPKAGDPGASPLDPPRPVEELLQSAEQFLASDDWHQFARAIRFVEMYRASSDDGEKSAELRDRWRRHARSRIEEIRKASGRGGLEADHIMDLQQIHDVDPEGPTGQAAHQLINETLTANKAATGGRAPMLGRAPIAVYSKYSKCKRINHEKHKNTRKQERSAFLGHGLVLTHN